MFLTHYFNGQYWILIRLNCLDLIHRYVKQYKQGTADLVCCYHLSYSSHRYTYMHEDDHGIHLYVCLCMSMVKWRSNVICLRCCQYVPFAGPRLLCFNQSSILWIAKSHLSAWGQASCLISIVIVIIFLYCTCTQY